MTDDLLDYSTYASKPKSVKKCVMVEPEKLSSLQAEVDKLKEALEKIATHSMYEAQHIANEALNNE